jgi:hypothetical protein
MMRRSILEKVKKTDFVHPESTPNGELSCNDTLDTLIMTTKKMYTGEGGILTTRRGSGTECTTLGTFDEGELDSAAAKRS